MINYVLVVYGLAISLLGIGQPEVRFVTEIINNLNMSLILEHM